MPRTSIEDLLAFNPVDGVVPSRKLGVEERLLTLTLFQRKVVETRVHYA